MARPPLHCSTCRVRQQYRHQKGAAAAPAAAEVSTPPQLLLWQQKRDAEGGGVSQRIAAEQELERLATTPGVGRCTAKMQCLTWMDRQLSDEARCAAYEGAVLEAIAGGVRCIVTLGVGSLLPALVAARAGAQVCVVEACGPLADIARASAVENGVTLMVAPSVRMAAQWWR